MGKVVVGVVGVERAKAREENPGGTSTRVVSSSNQREGYGIDMCSSWISTRCIRVSSRSTTSTSRPCHRSKTRKIWRYGISRGVFHRCANRKHISQGEGKIPEPPDDDVEQGVLPRLIATLVSRRRQVKSLMKDKTATQQKLLQVSFFLIVLSLA